MSAREVLELMQSLMIAPLAAHHHTDLCPSGLFSLTMHSNAACSIGRHWQGTRQGAWPVRAHAEGAAPQSPFTFFCACSTRCSLGPTPVMLHLSVCSPLCCTLLPAVHCSYTCATALVCTARSLRACRSDMLHEGFKVSRSFPCFLTTPHAWHEVALTALQAPCNAAGTGLAYGPTTAYDAQKCVVMPLHVMYWPVMLHQLCVDSNVLSWLLYFAYLCLLYACMDTGGAVGMHTVPFVNASWNACSNAPRLLLLHSVPHIQLLA